MKVCIQRVTTNDALSFGKLANRIADQVEHIAEVVETPSEADIHIYVGQPFWSQRSRWLGRSRVNLIYTMWEFPTTLPEKHVERINEYFHGLIVPCDWVMRLYRDAGVTIPIHIVPIGIDADKYKHATEAERREWGGDSFNFLWMGCLVGHYNQLRVENRPRTGDRKRGWLVRRAFEELGLDGANLILKGVPNRCGIRRNMSYKLGAGRVWEIVDFVSEERLRQIYGMSDILIWPTSGEGWGMIPLECMASGIPVAIPNYSGMTAYFHPSACLSLDYKIGRLWRSLAHRGSIVDIGEVKRVMQWAYDNRDECRAMGQRGVEIARQFTWEGATRPALARVLEVYGQRLAKHPISDICVS